MRKKILLATAIIMVLGSVKVMAADEMVENDAMIENAITKTEAAEADMHDQQAKVGEKEKALAKIREQIMKLKESGSPMDAVRIQGNVVSLGQALEAAEQDFSALQSNFNSKDAKEVSKILDSAIKSRK